VDDTLPGLSYAGEANMNMAQGFNNTLMLINTESRAEQERIRLDIEKLNARTTTYLLQYLHSIFEDADRRNFDHLLVSRAKYLEIRKQAIALAETGHQLEAMAMTRDKLFPAYIQYKEAGDQLFEYNMRQGQTRGQGIMQVCTATQFAVAAIGILIFVIGFLLGMFK
jgi:hypothetical protein